MEIEVHLRGTSCHASAPERGDNPIYKMSRLVAGDRKAQRSASATTRFLGKGTIAVTEIRSLSPSLCAVPGACTIHLDRRLTAGETKESAVAEVTALCPARKTPKSKSSPTTSPATPASATRWRSTIPPGCWTKRIRWPRPPSATFRRPVGQGPPVVDKWTFSTNGVASMGLMGVPTIGFGPGEEEVAHSVGERVPIRHLVEAAEFYAAFPLIYVATVRTAMAELVPDPAAAAVAARVPRVRARRQDLRPARRARSSAACPGLDLSVDFHGHRASTPLGPAAGPHGQLAQNIVALLAGRLAHHRAEDRSDPGRAEDSRAPASTPPTSATTSNGRRN